MMSKIMEEILKNNAEKPLTRGQKQYLDGRIRQVKKELNYIN